MKPRANRWYTAEKSPHIDVFAVIPEYESKARTRNDQFLRHASMYRNKMLPGMRPGQTDLGVLGADRMTFNVIANCVDTATALMAKSKPAPQFLTSGADYKLRRLSLKLNKMGKGAQHQMGIHRLGEELHNDKLIYGTCFVKVYSEGKKLRAERVYPWELLVDEQDAHYGCPSSLIQIKYVDRDRLAAMFPDDEEFITKCSSADTGYFGESLAADLVQVAECWKLGNGNKPGRHVICINNRTLLDEKWKRKRFPIIWSHWDQPRPTGFWGGSMVERLIPIQQAITLHLNNIEKIVAAFAVPRIIIEANSGIQKNQLTNSIGEILTIQPGTSPPQVLTPPPLLNEHMQQLQMLVARAYEEVGISQANATAKKPTGINSGVGVREVLEIGSERLVMYGLRWEEFHMDVVRVALDEVREIRGFTVDVPDKRYKEEVAWEDIDLDEDAYVLQCYPVSLLPQTPAGRYERIQEMMMSQLITREQGLELLQVPDMENMNSDMNAQTNSIKHRIDAMLDKGEYVAPEPYDDPQATLAVTKAIYFQEREAGAPESSLELLRAYMNSAAMTIQQNMAAMQASQQPPTGEPTPQQ